jgi:monoamine oxidase
MQSERGVETIADGHSIASQRVIVAVPPTLAARITYSPPLPALRDQLTQRVPMGSVIKAVAVYHEPFWREEGLDGLALDPDGAVIEMHDGSPNDASVGIIVAFAEGRGGRAMSEVPETERRRVFLETFERFFGSRAASPRAYIEKDWSADPWSRGCYGGHLGAGVWTEFGPALRRPCGRIHWAGTETAERWSGYMDGAVRSGERAAREVLAAD